MKPSDRKAIVTILRLSGICRSQMIQVGMLIECQ